MGPKPAVWILAGAQRSGTGWYFRRGPGSCVFGAQTWYIWSHKGPSGWELGLPEVGREAQEAGVDRKGGGDPTTRWPAGRS